MDGESLGSAGLRLEARAQAGVAPLLRNGLTSLMNTSSCHNFFKEPLPMRSLMQQRDDVASKG